MNTNTPPISKIAVITRIIKTLPYKTIGKIALALAVILVIVIAIYDYYSPRNIIGIQPQQRVLAGEIYDTTNDALTPGAFSSATMTEVGTSGSVVSTTYPITGITELDSLIKEQTTAFTKKVAATAGENMYYNTNSSAYGKYLFTTIYNNDRNSSGPAFENIGYNVKGSLLNTADFLIKDGYTDIIKNKTIESLSTAFQLQHEVSTKLALKAIEQRHYRLAPNGLVLLLSTKEMNVPSISLSYYEVLIPNELIQDFLK